MSGQNPKVFNNPTESRMNNPIGNQMRNNQMMNTSMRMMNPQMNFAQPTMMNEQQVSQPQQMQGPPKKLARLSEITHGPHVTLPQQQIQQPQLGEHQNCLQKSRNAGNVSNLIGNLGNPQAVLGGPKSQPQSQQMQSLPKKLSHASEVAHGTHVTLPQQQIQQPQLGEHQNCLQKSRNAGNVSNLIGNLGNPQAVLGGLKSQPQSQQMQSLPKKLSLASEIAHGTHVTLPQHQIQQYQYFLQKSKNPGNVSNLIGNLGNPQAVPVGPQSQPQPEQMQSLPKKLSCASEIAHGTHQIRQPQLVQHQYFLQKSKNPGNVSNLIGNLSTPQAVPGSHPQVNQPQQMEFNTASLCRLGQETVQDISCRLLEVLNTLKRIQPPNINTPLQSTETTQKTFSDHLRSICLLFKRLRLLYDKCNDQQDLGMPYTDIESLIPLQDKPDHKLDAGPSEEYKKHLQENRELTEAVISKNKQLKEIIDRMRIMNWEINTMLSMRRS